MTNHSEEMPQDPQANDGRAEVMSGEEGSTEIAPSAAFAMTKGEIESQLDAAHKYPRSIARFLKDSVSVATVSVEVAESCLYALPRGKNKDGTVKVVAGPSVRLAEILASSYGNLHIATRVLAAEAKEIVAQGVVWDLEKNLKVCIETRRKITNKNGFRFNDDMINVTGEAAASIAYRNAVFRVVPRGLVDSIYATVRETAVGNAKTLGTRRASVVMHLQKMGVPIDRIFARVQVAGVEDINLEELEILIGLGTAVRTNSQTIDDAFPPVDDTAKRSKGLEDDLKKPDLRVVGDSELLKLKVERVAHDADGVVKEPTADAKPVAKPEPKAEAKPPTEKKKPADGVDDAAAEAALAGKVTREPGQEG
jgi:hypothetical protein